ncbi:HNH endonuclease signature motif containing protein [Arthrobacter cupressi]
MPRSAPTRCTEPGCGTLVPAGSRCGVHRREAWQNTSARNRAIDKGKWIKVKRTHLRREPGCRVCGTTAGVEVDHIIEVTDGGALYDDANLATLCLAHHREKTAAQRQSRAARDHP